MGRKQLLSVAVVFKGAGFTDQPVNNVPVLNVVFTFAAQSRDFLYTLLGVPYLQMFYVNSYLYIFSDQAAIHRIHIMVSPDCAARSNSDLKPLAAIKTLGR